MATRTAGSRLPAWLAVFLVAAVFVVLPAAAHGQAVAVTVEDGVGRVTSAPAGIDCPGTCTATFTAGEQVTLTAAPAPGYAFGVPNPQGDAVDDTGWGFECSQVPGEPSRCTLQVPADGETEVGAAFRPAALLLVVANGGGGLVRATIPNPQVGETGQQTCNSSDEGGVVCPYPYLPGRAVTLTPSPLAAPFPIWSDDDCLDASACTVVLDELRRSITATFGTQHVFVRVNGPGRVFSTPPGINCTVTGDDPQDCPGGVFPTGQDVALTAEGASPVWVTDPDPTRAGCDSAAGAVCHVFAERSRWAVVSFAGVTPDQQYPPRASARFRVSKAGDGSGTVRGSGIDCGSRCSVDTNYGQRFVLVADASPGSRFVRWRRGCGESARCPLTVGPTTRVTAVFERAGASAATLTPTLRATLRRVGVRRIRGRYRIVMPLRVNLAARVSVRLTRRGRRVAGRSMQLRAGDRRLILRVRTRRGRYRLSLTVRSIDGQVQRINRTLRLR